MNAPIFTSAKQQLFTLCNEAPCTHMKELDIKGVRLCDGCHKPVAPLLSTYTNKSRQPPHGFSGHYCKTCIQKIQNHFNVKLL